MGVKQAARRAKRPGRHWLFTAIVMPLNPLAWWAQAVYNEHWSSCVAAHPGADDRAFVGPCGADFTITAIAVLALVPLTVTVGVGLVLGVIDGWYRSEFAEGRWICATVVTLTGPPTMATYTLGYGLGCLLPAPKPDATVVAHQQGWHTAVQLFSDLAGGRRPPHVIAPGLPISEPVYLDVSLRYARYYGMDVAFQPDSTLAVGSPAFVTGAVVGNLIGNSIGWARAASLSRTQWRDHRIVRVVLTATTTWCCVEGRWVTFDHTSVMEYHLNGANCVLAFADAEPLMLAGPSAACHAVLFAYLRGGPTWPRIPFLHAIAAAASHDGAQMPQPS